VRALARVLITSFVFPRHHITPPPGRRLFFVPPYIRPPMHNLNHLLAMRAATRSAVRSFPAPSRTLSTTRARRAGGWDNKARPGEDTLAHALKSLSSRTRLTRPQTEAYTAIFKQAVKHADRHERPLPSQIRASRLDESLIDSLPFDVVMTAIAEADGARLSLETDALAYISYVRFVHDGPNSPLVYQKLPQHHPIPAGPGHP